MNDIEIIYPGSRYKVETFLNPDYDSPLRQDIDDISLLNEEEKEALDNLYKDLNKKSV